MEVWKLRLNSLSVLCGLSLGIGACFGREAAAETESVEISAQAGGILKLSFVPSVEIERADLYFWTPESETPIRAVLILAPGRNGNGLKMIEQEVWKQFALEHHLLLCGVSFASNKRFVDQSYSNGHSGSGEMLLRGIDLISEREGHGELPLLMYGFSAGARFTASVVEAHSERFIAWSACAVGKWQDARETKSHPPGIVASGEWDAGCYHASLLYFQQGRKLNKPWMWLSLAETGHQRSDALDEFVRAFFDEMMKRPLDERPSGHFFDIDTRKELSSAEVEEWPIFAGWVPTGSLKEKWLQLHHP